MAKQTKISTEIVLKQLKRFPKTPSLTLAKKIYKENPKVYTSIEHVRAIIRTYRGTTGKRSRKYLKNKEFVVAPKEKGDTNPFAELPEEKHVSKEIFKLPTSIKKVLLISDLHFPFHSNEAIKAALKDGIKEQVDCVFINGDMLDFYQLSFHEKDPRKTNIAEELEMGRTFLKLLRKTFPKATIYFIPANHEIRMQRYLKIKAPELLDMDEFKIDTLLKVREYGVNYLEYGTKCYFGKLLVEHGDKLKGSGGVNPARTLLLKLKRHAICGHFHRTTQAIEKIYDGDNLVAYSTGCLCTLEPDYMEVNNHNHGHAIIEMFKDGNFSVKNKTIVNGVVY